MTNTQYTQKTPPVNHPFPIHNGIRTPESTALMNKRFVKTKVNPIEGLDDALL